MLNDCYVEYTPSEYFGSACIETLLDSLLQRLPPERMDWFDHDLHQTWNARTPVEIWGLEANQIAEKIENLA